MKNFRSKFEKLYTLVIESIKLKETDPHELMTACLLFIDDLSYYKNNDIKKDDLDDLLIKIYAIAKDSNKIKNASLELINSINLYSRKYDALCQAISAAEMIRKKNPGNISMVYLTGNSQDNDIATYFGIENLLEKGIDSHSMKDFNSSDIVIKIDERFIGISLKKKERSDSIDPTLTNVALSVFFKDTKKIDELFSEFFGKCIIKYSNIFFNEEIQEKLYPLYIQGKIYYLDKKENEKNKLYNVRISKTQKSEFIEKFKKSLQDKKFVINNWKSILSSSNGLFLTHENRELIRSCMNEELKTDESVLPKIDKEIIAKSNEIGSAFLHIVFKDTLEKLSEYKFDFNLCIGIGRMLKNSIIIDDAEFKSIKDITSKLKEIANNKDNAKIIASNDPSKNNNDRFTKKSDNISVKNNGIFAAKLFYDLKYGNSIIANIEVRYKGSYTSYPQFFATFDKKFIEEFKRNGNDKI